MTALYFFRFSSVNATAFSVVSTANPFSFPNCIIAVCPYGIELCLKPAVFEKTNTRFCALVANEKKASAKRTINLDLNISCLFTIIMTSLRGHKFRCKKRRKIAAFKIFGQNCIKITTVLT